MAQANNKNVTEAFEEHEVVPDVIPKAPKNLVKVVFDSGVEVMVFVYHKYVLKANLGEILTPTQVKNEPEVSWETEPNQLYTLIKTDPDAPSRKEPINREFEHWYDCKHVKKFSFRLVVNIPDINVKKGDTLAQYVGSGAPKNTGLHRYVYLVYKQPNGEITDPEHGHLKIKGTGDKRRKWSANAFAKKHNLGDPIAGNFFQVVFLCNFKKFVGRIR